MPISIEKLKRFIEFEKKNIQEKVFIVLALCLFAIFVYLIFFYLPMNKQAQSIRGRINEMQEHINKIRKVSDKSGDLKSVIDFYSDKQEKLGKSLPMSGEVVIKDLLSVANKLNIEIVSLTPQKPEPAKIGIPVKYGICEEMVVLIDCKASYKRLGEYLEALQYELPQCMAINTISIKNEEGSADKLRVNIKLTSYLYY